MAVLSRLWCRVSMLPHSGNQYLDSRLLSPCSHRMNGIYNAHLLIWVHIGHSEGLLCGVDFFALSYRVLENPAIFL